MRCKSRFVALSPSSFRSHRLCSLQKAAQDHRCLQSSAFALEAVFLTSPLIVVAADGLSKREVFRLPDPFAVITVDAEQTHTSSVIKKTLNPYWNESFDM